MANSMNDAARDGYLDLLDKMETAGIENVPAETYSGEVATTLATISDIYKTALTPSEIEGLQNSYTVFNNVADELRLLIEIANICVLKVMTQVNSDEPKPANPEES